MPGGALSAVLTRQHREIDSAIGLFMKPRDRATAAPRLTATIPARYRTDAPVKPEQRRNRARRSRS